MKRNENAQRSQQSDWQRLNQSSKQDENRRKTDQNSPTSAQDKKRSSSTDLQNGKGTTSFPERIGSLGQDLSELERETQEEEFSDARKVPHAKNTITRKSGSQTTKK